jgi:hypothetical protein
VDGVLPGVANTQGENGSEWHSDVFLHNAGLETPITVDLFFATTSGIASEAVRVTVLPLQTLALPDVLASQFGKTGGGALQWAVAGGDEERRNLFVQGNTYNRVSATKQYGQQVPGVRWADAAGAGGFQLMPAYDGTYYTGGFFRTNLGIVGNESCTEVVVRAMNRFGNILHQERVSMTPFQWVQINDVYDHFKLESGFIHQLGVMAVNGKAIAYATIIDNISNDGSYFLGQAYAHARATHWLPGVALARGQDGTDWHSDVFLLNQNNEWLDTVLSFFGAGQEDQSPTTSVLNLPSGNGKWLPDVLASQFGLEPNTSGAIKVDTNDTDRIFPFMRTYTNAKSAIGQPMTFGLAIAPRTDEEMIVGRDVGVVVGVSHDATRRSNLIMVNTLRSSEEVFFPGTATIEIFNKYGGSLLEAREYPLRAGEFLQDNKFLENLGDVEDVSLHVRFASDHYRPGETRGGLDVRVSEINGNRIQGTNDGRLVTAQRFTPGGPFALINEYVREFFPGESERFFLDNYESRTGVRYFSESMAEILIEAPGAIERFGGVQGLVQWLEVQTDGVLNAGGDDLYHGFDPVEWSPLGESHVRFFMEPTGADTVDFVLRGESLAAFRNLVVDYILPASIFLDPVRYGNLVRAPTWGTQDANP